jgi:DNA-binding response OmpR family regulator
VSSAGFPNYSSNEGQYRPGKILIIEDHLEILKLLRIFLDSKGYETLTEKNALDLMKVCLAEKPDVIILDTGLPYREVDNVYAELRGDTQTRQIPIVFVVPKDSESSEWEKVKGLGLNPKDAIVEVSDFEGLAKNVEEALPSNRRPGGRILWQAGD